VMAMWQRRCRCRAVGRTVGSPVRGTGGWRGAGRYGRVVGLGALAWWVVSALAQEVVLNEIYYHPPSGDAREEYLELHNRGAQAVDLTGWRLSRGVQYTFSRVSLMAQGYLVVAADVETFKARYPGVTAVVGGWTGTLSRRGERLELEDAAGVLVDRVTYADEGDWAVRWRTHDWLLIPTWEWLAEADGRGKSLELIDASRDNDIGQNWGASLGVGGTPGGANSVAGVNRGPFITQVQHRPAVPRATEQVAVTARVEGAGPTPPRVFLHHRLDGQPAFKESPMMDHGLAGDGLAWDGVFGVYLPAQTNGAIVEFYVRAVGAEGGERLWPADPIPAGTARANLLYQVDEQSAAGSQPFYRIVMTEADRAAYAARVAERPGLFSDATTSATFVSTVDGETQVRYLADVRNRGQGSRYANVYNFRVDFRSDDLWQGVEKVNLNAYYHFVQVLGSALGQVAGLVMPESRVVQVRLNRTNMSPAIYPRYGIYAHNEVPDGDYTARHLLGQANVYRALRDYSEREPDLSYRGDSPDLYRADYFKETNQSEDDWSDLIGLTRALDASQTPDEEYVGAVERWVYVPNWMLYFALNTFVVNRETSLGNGIGDDYMLYREVTAGRFHLVPWDFDTILNQGDTRGAVDTGFFLATRLPAIRRFLQHPQLVPTYYRRLKELCDTVFAPERFNPLVAQVLQDAISEQNLEDIRAFTAARRAYVLSQIPLALTLEHDLPIAHGYARASSNRVALAGRAHAIETRAVRVNGAPALWSAWEARWRADAVPLEAGVNRLVVQAFDQDGREIDRRVLDVWREATAVTPVAGTIRGANVWRASEGPRRLTGTVTVEPGATLTLEPGVTVYLEAGARLVVRGSLVAEGQDAGRVRLTRVPGTDARWEGLVFEDAALASRLVGADLEYGGASRPVVTVRRSEVSFLDVTWGTAAQPAVAFEDASLRFERCQFGSASGADVVTGVGLRAGGELLLRGNRWANLDGAGWALRVTGAASGPRRVRIEDNEFAGSQVRAVELRGADGWLDGNGFIGAGTAAGPAVRMTGELDHRSHLVLARSGFLGLDRAIVLEEGAWLTAHNNTFSQVRQATVSFGAQTAGAVGSAGAELVNAIFDEVTALFSGHALVPPERIAVRWSLFSGAPFWAGEGNLEGAARLDWVAGRPEPRPGSAALGQGWLGWDMGAAVPRGLGCVAPLVSPTPSRRAQVWVWGPGLVEYEASVDGGAFGSGRSLAQPLELVGLAEGMHSVAVRARDAGGAWREPVAHELFRWRVDPAATPILLQEVKAGEAVGGTDAVDTDGWVELLNRGDEALNLTGMGLSDDDRDPYRYLFTPGPELEPGRRRVVSAKLLGYRLSPAGERVRLFASRLAGGAMLDEVTFGPQVSGYALGREEAGGAWGLAWPTPGVANRRSPLGDPSGVVINEWLTRGRDPAEPDFVELYNRDALPVALAGLYLSDHPVTAPQRQGFPPLSYQAGRGWLALWRGQESDRHAGLGFGLTADQGLIGLLDADGRRLDVVWYAPQQRGTSMGRLPDGGATLAVFAMPAPGAPNGALPPTGGAQSLALVQFTDTWRYDEGGVSLGTAWRANAFNDAAWPSGAGLFFAKPAPLPAALNTQLKLGSLTYYFRRRFEWPLSQRPDALRLWTILDDGAVIYLNGQELLRIGLPEGTPVSHDTLAGRTVIDAFVEGPFALPPDRLLAGENVLAVEVHQATPGSSDLTFGLSLEAVVSNLPPAEVVINEVLADNRSALLQDRYDGDWIELRNRSVYPADLGDMSLSDDPAVPRKFIFPAGTWLAGHGLLVLRCDPDQPASGDHTGFGLNRGGDAVYLFRAPAAGGALADAIVFGFQAPDLALARVPGAGSGWGPARPTPGGQNEPVLVGDASTLRINEWMARPTQGDDWFELYHPEPHPIDLGGLLLSDDPAEPGKRRIPDHSYIGGDWYRHQKIVADGNPDAGADHVNFRLSAAGDAILLHDALGHLIDGVRFGPQAENVSEGRLPDGAATLATFSNRASPGAANDTDADRDGLPDGWELAHGLSPADPQDGWLDLDGDGLDNESEYLCGTDPRDPASLPRVEAGYNRLAEPSLRFLAQPGRAYVLEVSPQLPVVAWASYVRFKPRVRAEWVELSVPRPPHGTGHFYRFRVD